MGTPPRTLTIKDASARSGLSEKALRRRIERAVLPSVLGHDGRRRIPVSALQEAGLLPHDGAVEDAPTGNTPHAGAPTGEPAFGELLQRLEALAGENGRLRALTDGHERRERELELQLHQAHAETKQLQAQLAATPAPRRRWFRRQA